MPARAASVLVVDDDAMTCEILSDRLRREGFEVVVAPDGGSALGKVRDHRIDLVLLDVMMPGASGIEVLEQLRERHAAIDLPIIMATGRGDSEEIVRALGLGANDYVTKPLDFPVVLARVRTHLALKRMAGQLKRLERRLADRNRELEQTNKRLANVNSRMSRDLKAAARHQESFLPTDLAPVPGIAFAWIYRPCAELAGDGLSVIPLGGDKFGLYVFDVSGHGVAAALLSVTLCRFLSPPSEPSSVLGRGGATREKLEIASPAKVADRLNRFFPFESSTEQFATLLYGVLDSVTGEFRFASAGHPGPVHLAAGASPVVLRTKGAPIGLARQPFEERTVRLEVGDRLYLYSDGLSETIDPAGQAFGDERLLSAIGRVRSAPLQDGVTSLVDEIDLWRGTAAAADDVSILAVEFSAEPSTVDPQGGPPSPANQA
jgi:sigma-B regulation protein RsbU (phosphoserine phosphatase)